MMSEFRVYWKKGIVVSARWYWLIVSGFGIQRGGKRKIWGSVFSEVDTSQMNGIRKMTLKKISTEWVTTRPTPRPTLAPGRVRARATESDRSLISSSPRFAALVIHPPIRGPEHDERQDEDDHRRGP